MNGTTGGRGIVVYDVQPDIDTRHDDLAFGFMTYQLDGVLVRLDNSFSKEYIELQLVSLASCLVLKASRHVSSLKPRVMSRP